MTSLERSRTGSRRDASRRGRRCGTTARKRLGGGLVLEVARHHGIAADHDLAGRDAVGRNRPAGHDVDHPRPGDGIRTPCRAFRSARSASGRPLHSSSPRADHDGPVTSRSARRAACTSKPEPSIALQYGRRGRGAAPSSPARCAGSGGASAELGQHDQERRRAAQVRNACSAIRPRQATPGRSPAGRRRSRPSSSPPRRASSRCSGTAAASRGSRCRRQCPAGNVPSAFR